MREYFIPNNVEVVFVSDFFAEDITGGAELTMQAIIDASPSRCFKLHSQSFSAELAKKNLDKKWVLVNYSGANLSEIYYGLVKTGAEYYVVECDYKYCSYRSKHLHKLQTGKRCDCHRQQQGKMVAVIMGKATKTFFMSREQMGEYKRLFPVMAKWTHMKVQGSTFDEKTIDFLEELYHQRKKQGYKNKWTILGGGSWIKNQDETVKYCEDNNIPYEIVGGLPYEQFLAKLSEYKGLVFHPKGFDTAPRIVIEAKYMGLEMDLNSNVQIRGDKWFADFEHQQLREYLLKQPEYFWKEIDVC